MRLKIANMYLRERVDHDLSKNGSSRVGILANRVKSPLSSDSVVVFRVGNVKKDSIRADGGRANRVTVVAPVASDVLVAAVKVLDLVVKTRIFLRGTLSSASTSIN